MKLTEEKSQTLLEILHAQSKIKPIVPKNTYFEKLKKVRHLFNYNKNDGFTGGVKPEILEANPNNPELLTASNLHKRKGEERLKRIRHNPTPHPDGSKNEETLSHVIQNLDRASATETYKQQVVDPSRAEVKGINISTKSSDRLGKRLTNPNWGAKDSKQMLLGSKRLSRGAKV